MHVHFFFHCDLLSKKLYISRSKWHLQTKTSTKDCIFVRYWLVLTWPYPKFSLCEFLNSCYDIINKLKMVWVNLFLHTYAFSRLCRRWPLKLLWEMQHLLIMSKCFIFYNELKPPSNTFKICSFICHARLSLNYSKNSIWSKGLIH